jgi:hypothetical protein
LVCSMDCAKDKTQEYPSERTSDNLIKGLGSVSISIGPVHTRKLKFHHLHFFLWELFVQ